MSAFAERFGEYAKTLDCVHCGLCAPQCPTYRVSGRESESPRGRIHLMRGWAEGRFELTPRAHLSLDRCLVCRACESVCPSGVQMAEMVESFRHEQQTAGKADGFGTSRWSRMLLREVLPHRGRIALLTDALAGLQKLGLARWPIGPKSARQRLPQMPARGTRRLATDDATVSDICTGDAALPASRRACGERRGSVALFLGCIASEWFAPVHHATIRVLTKNGWDVYVPHDQTCCGALDRHAGRLPAAQALIERNQHVFAATGVDAVVVNAAGCGASMREPLAATAATTSVVPPFVDISSFLAEQGLRAPLQPLPLRVAYDSPCHLLHAQGVGGSVVEDLLRTVPELQIVPLRGADRCCGAAGVYNLTHADMAEPILADKIDAILEADVEVVATGNPGCAMQIAAGLRERGSEVQVAHPVELLDRALG